MKQGVTPELESFLQRIRSPALAFAVVRQRDEDAALDMVQETMIGFVKVAANYETEAWKNLFYKILLRRITDWQRKVAWRKRLYPILPFSQLGDADDDETDETFTHAGNATVISNLPKSTYS